MLRDNFYLALFLLVLPLAHAPLVAAETVETGTQSTPPTTPQGSDLSTTASDATPAPSVADPTARKNGVVPLKKAPQTATKQDSPAKALPPPDRRWIIKAPQPDPKKIKKAPVRKVKWNNNTQKKQCEAYLNEIGSIFLKARYYSIQGDSCACAENSEHFLELYRRAETDCPDNYLEGAGYTPRIERNMSWLSALGKEQCVGPAKSPANATVKPQITPSGAVDTPGQVPPETASHKKVVVPEPPNRKQ